MKRKVITNLSRNLIKLHGYFFLKRIEYYIHCPKVITNPIQISWLPKVFIETIKKEEVLELVSLEDLYTIFCLGNQKDSGSYT